MKNYHDLLFFRENRVWRCYPGGKLLDRLMNNPSCEDTLFPENWLGSVTKADNGVHQTSPDEGLSRLKSGEIFADVLKDHAEELLGKNNSMDVLCKFLDSALRLPLQCHPDRAFAKKYCHSDFGKTESWFILNTREINGEKPYLLMGFKPGVNKEEFKKAVLEQNIPLLESMFHKIEAKVGDSYIIPGGLPHAIGTGVLLLEVQEPTDLVVQPEEKIGDVTLTQKDMWQNLTVEQGLNCFSYKGYTEDEVKQAFALIPRNQNGSLAELVNADNTECFRVWRMTLKAGENYNFQCQAPWYLAAVTNGDGKAEANGAQHTLTHGDCFMIPNPVREVSFTAGADGLTVYLITH